MLVQRTRQLLVKRLLLLETGDEDFEELLECGDGEVLPAVIVDRHLLHLRVLLHELLLLGFQGGAPRPLLAALA